MDVPNHFKEDDQEKLQQYIRDYSFGLLIIADHEGIEANHVPFYLSSGANDSLGQLQCHLARSNPVWQRIQGGAQLLAVFRDQTLTFHPHGTQPRQRQAGSSRHGIIWLSMHKVALILLRTQAG